MRIPFPFTVILIIITVMFVFAVIDPTMTINDPLNIISAALESN